MNLINRVKKWYQKQNDRAAFEFEFNEFSGSYPLRNPNAKKEYITRKMKERGY